MNKSLDSFRLKLSKIRAGRANVDILDSVRVEYYGDMVPLNQVASLSVSDAKTIVIDPWDKSMLEGINKAIQKANLGLNPSTDTNSKIIRIIIPPLTEERRKEFVKIAKKELEEAKISLRNIRHKANSAIKNDDLSEDEKRSKEKSVQKILDEFTKKAEEIFSSKEKDIMSI